AYRRARGPFKKRRLAAARTATGSPRVVTLEDLDGAVPPQGADRRRRSTQPVPQVQPAPRGGPGALARARGGVAAHPARGHLARAARPPAGQPVPPQAVREALPRRAGPLRADAALAPPVAPVPRRAGPHPGARADGPGVHPPGPGGDAPG